MNNQFSSELEPLFSDLKSLKFNSFVISNEFKRFCIKNQIKHTIDQYFRKIQDQRHFIAVGFDFSELDMGDAVLFYLNEIYYRSISEFYYFVKLFIEKYEEWSNEKIYIVNIIKDLELLSDYQEYEELFANIGTTEKIIKKVERQTIDTNDNKKEIQNNSIFIVHGHNNEMKESVARFIEKLGLDPIILHEKPNKGMTIIEKIESFSAHSAIILLSPDDIGNAKDKSENLLGRARQNVILELGYFMGKLGRNKVCAILKDEVEKPSDFDGILYIPYNHSWKVDLAKELRCMGFSIDMNKVI